MAGGRWKDTPATVRRTPQSRIPCPDLTPHPQLARRRRRSQREGLRQSRTVQLRLAVERQAVDPPDVHAACGAGGRARRVGDTRRSAHDLPSERDRDEDERQADERRARGDPNGATADHPAPPDPQEGQQGQRDEVRDPHREVRIGYDQVGQHARGSRPSTARSTRRRSRRWRRTPTCCSRSSTSPPSTHGSISGPATSLSRRSRRCGCGSA